MAKKKAAVIDDENEDGGLEIEEVVEKKKKVKDLASISIGASSLVDRDSIIISVSPTIDLMLGGGIPEGSFVIPTGPPKVGKTSFALQFSANAMRPEYNCEFNPKGRTVYFFNIEGRLKKRDLLGIHGLDINRVEIVGSKLGKILSAEDYIEEGERLINEKPGDIFIFDSFSQLCTRARRDADLGDRFRDDTSLLLASFCKRICNVVPINRSVVIGITHLIANQGGRPGQSPWSEASGQKIQYAVDVKMKATHKKPWMSGDTQIGQEVYWKCESSAIGAPGQCMSRLRYGYGIDKEAELVDLASEAGLITKSGSWYAFPDGTSAQGIDGARNKLAENPDMYFSIYADLRKILGLDRGV